MLHRIEVSEEPFFEESFYIDIDNEGDAVLLRCWRSRGELLACICSDCMGEKKAAMIARMACCLGAKRVFVSQGARGMRCGGAAFINRCECDKAADISKWAEEVATEITFIEAQEHFLAGLT